MVAPECFQTQQGFVTFDTPELAWALEAALGLTTGGLDWAAANGFAGPPPGPIIHAVLVFVKVLNLFGKGLRRRAAGQRRQDFLQLSDDFEGGIVFELFDQGLEPSLEAGLVFAKERPPDGHQMLDGMVAVQPLAGLWPTVIGQSPNPRRPIANDQRAGPPGPSHGARPRREVVRAGRPGPPG